MFVWQSSDKAHVRPKWFSARLPDLTVGNGEMLAFLLQGRTSLGWSKGRKPKAPGTLASPEDLKLRSPPKMRFKVFLNMFFFFFFFRACVEIPFCRKLGKQILPSLIQAWSISSLSCHPRTATFDPVSVHSVFLLSDFKEMVATFPASLLFRLQKQTSFFFNLLKSSSKPAACVLGSKSPAETLLP